MPIDISEIVRSAIQQKASDIHLMNGSPPIFRIFGNLVVQSLSEISSQDTQKWITELCSPKQLEMFSKNQDIDFAFRVDEHRVRVNAHIQRGSPAYAMRIISKDVPSLENLGLPKILQKFSSLPQGLVLVTGITGSGKSTTQAAMIRHISEHLSTHIITIEDPIEYDLATVPKKSGTLVKQREVGSDTPTFTSALKHVLRQDPDVILIGEMRDYETISIALTAAETGHLVISTLHTLDACQSIDRMIDVFPPTQQAQVRIQLSLVLEGICSQRIFPRQDGSGAVVAMEVMVVNSGIRNLIRTAKSAEIYSMIELGKEHGMQSMDDAIENLVAKRMISQDEAKIYMKKPEKLSRYGVYAENRTIR